LADGSPVDDATDRFGGLTVLDPRLANLIVDQAIERYIAARHARVAGFVDRHYALSGALTLHARALGWDLVRAPVNLLAALPQSALLLGAAAGRTLGRRRPRLRAAAARLGRLQLLLTTDVGRELAWLIQTELLELPARQGERVATRDALAEAIAADPRLMGALAATARALGRHADDPLFRNRLDGLIAAYTGSRGASADIATSLLATGAGALAARQFTPGALSLGPVIAGALAQHAAISSFPLGPALGGLWYGAFPAAAAPGLAAASSGALLLGLGALAAFAGVVADPVQRRLGLHHRRLHKMIGALEAQLLGRGHPGFQPRDHYVARLLDTLDLLRSLHRLAG
jgi:hypothetical protein